MLKTSTKLREIFLKFYEKIVGKHGTMLKNNNNNNTTGLWGNYPKPVEKFWNMKKFEVIIAPKSWGKFIRI